MPTSTEVTWDCPSQTVIKHNILRGYLNAWFPILARYHGRVIYVDGFAGPGHYNEGQPGSPIIAIEAAIKQEKFLINSEVCFYFIEEDKNRFKNLELSLSKIQVPDNFKLYPVHGNFVDFMNNQLDEIDESRSSNAPIFSFIDPFGFSDVPYDLLRRLLKRERVEVFVYFARNSINRFLEVDKVTHHMESLFGEKNIAIPKGAKRIEYLKELYQLQLKKIARYVGLFTMINGRGVANYDLFFASNNPLGYVKMKEAMWSVDESGGFKFIQEKDPNQSILFRHDPTHTLERAILEKGKSVENVAVATIRKFVEEETIYLSKHMKSVLRRLELNKNIVVHSRKNNGDLRRKNSFPDETMVDFK